MEANRLLLPVVHPQRVNPDDDQEDQHRTDLLAQSLPDHRCNPILETQQRVSIHMNRRVSDGWRLGLN